MREERLLCAMGHKVNHSFRPNSVFGVMSHPRYKLTRIISAHHYHIVPRWGRVRTVVTTCHVSAGQEILVDYGYDLLRCPLWYRQLWSQQIGVKTGQKYWEYKPATTARNV